MNAIIWEVGVTIIHADENKLPLIANAALVMTVDAINNRL